MSKLYHCDFCYASVRVEDAWSYLIKPWVIQGSLFGSKDSHDDGEWCACTACHLLLKKGDIEGIMERSLANDPAAAAIPQAKAWKRHIFEHILAAPLLVPPFTGPPRYSPQDAQRRGGGIG